ncbi:MAG TPA: DUF1566 domain-containing protein [bacterium]|nr:DUF1566 domain-containing protein [bacterium]
MYRLLLILVSVWILVSCDKEAENVYSLELIDGSPVVTGSENGLMWYMDDPENPNTKLNLLTYAKAEELCADMDYAGFTDWRLPTIDELRGLVTGFGDIETGGKCKVTSKCLAMSCLYQGQKSESDYPCANEETELLQGPGPDGCYFDEVWRTYCGKYWSSSKLKGVVDEMAFQLDFSDPAILYALSGGSTNVGFARCVR